MIHCNRRKFLCSAMIGAALLTAGDIHQPELVFTERVPSGPENVIGQGQPVWLRGTYHGWPAPGILVRST